MLTTFSDGRDVSSAEKSSVGNFTPQPKAIIVIRSFVFNTRGDIPEAGISPEEARWG
jgi:hypothetical protein